VWERGSGGKVCEKEGEVVRGDGAERREKAVV